MKVCSYLPPNHPRALARIRAVQEALAQEEERRVERANNPHKVYLEFNHCVRELVFASPAPARNPELSEALSKALGEALGEA
jgi:hypothetical protein